MNSGLEAPLEALALEYLSFGFLTTINNLWTWVAVVTGAFSFLLTIRKPAPSVSSKVLSDSETRILDLVHESDESLDSSETSTTCVNVPALPPRADDEATDWTTRRKFAVYFKNEDVDREREEDGSRVLNNLIKLRSSSAKTNEWEWDMMMRMGILTGEEMGWYSHQDLTVLSGNVVRLWESCR